MEGALQFIVGDVNTAFACFDRAIDEREANVVWLRSPFYNSIRSDPRQRALLRRMQVA